jgi:hypothetical protein
MLATVLIDWYCNSELKKGVEITDGSGNRFEHDQTRKKFLLGHDLQHMWNPSENYENAYITEYKQNTTRNDLDFGKVYTRGGLKDFVIFQILVHTESNNKSLCLKFPPNLSPFLKRFAENSNLQKPDSNTMIWTIAAIPAQTDFNDGKHQDEKAYRKRLLDLSEVIRKPRMCQDVPLKIMNEGSLIGDSDTKIELNTIIPVWEHIPLLNDGILKKMRAVPIKGDGHCFYHSILYCLRKLVDIGDMENDHLNDFKDKGQQDLRNLVANIANSRLNNSDDSKEEKNKLKNQIDGIQGSAHGGNSEFKYLMDNKNDNPFKKIGYFVVSLDSNIGRISCEAHQCERTDFIFLLLHTGGHWSVLEISPEDNDSSDSEDGEDGDAEHKYVPYIQKFKTNGQKLSLSDMQVPLSLFVRFSANRPLMSHFETTCLDTFWH